MPIINLTRRAVAATALLAATACLSGESTSIIEKTVEETTFAASLGVNLAASTKTANGAYYRDLVVGTGTTVASGQTIAVRYTGWLANGTQFDSNTTLANPLTFKVGSGQVIAGFDEALVGAKVGSRRQLLIPPSLGYGPYDYGPIPGNSVLVFNVEVISVQ
jgi:FKBP-type peptidyl-prolyl cis-trans isomerase